MPADRASLPWFVFLLLLASVWINYIHRGALGVAAPVFGPELGLTATQTGWLLSAFFWTYSLCLMLSGWLVERVNVKHFYTAGFLIWSLATLATSAATGFATLIALRMLLGAAQSVAFPCYSKILASGFAEERRGFANALVDVGTKAGPAVATFLGGRLVAAYGWRQMFVLLGGAALLWLLPWLWRAPADLGRLPQRRTSPVAVRDIIGRRAAWATFCGLFFFNYTFFFLITWLPSYLVRQRHLTVETMAVVGALPFAATAIASFTAGWLSDLWIRRGGAVSFVRKTIAVSGLAIAGLCLPGTNLADERAALSLMGVAFVGIGIFTSNVWAITQTLAGPRAAGTWTGIQNGIGNMGGVVSPIVTGWCVDRFGSFDAAFLIAAAALLSSAGCYGLWLHRVEPVIQ